MPNVGSYGAAFIPVGYLLTFVGTVSADIAHWSNYSTRTLFAIMALVLLIGGAILLRSRRIGSSEPVEAKIHRE